MSSLIKSLGISINIFNKSKTIQDIQQMRKEVELLQKDAGNIRIVTQKAVQKATQADVNVARTARYSDEASVLVNAVKDKRIAAAYGLSRGGLRSRAQERIIAGANKQFQTSPTAEQLERDYRINEKVFNNRDATVGTIIKAARKSQDLRSILSGNRAIDPNSQYNNGSVNFLNNGKSVIEKVFGQQIENSTLLDQVDKIRTKIDNATQLSVQTRNNLEKKLEQQIEKVKTKGANSHKKVEKEKTATTEKESEKRENAEKESVEEVSKAEQTAEEKAKEMAKTAQSYFQTAFSMHILQVYALPLIQFLKRITTESLQVYAEFDKRYVDYLTKSEDYAAALERIDFYKMAKGETFGLSNSAITAERFAASGIDVAQSQEALTATMQVATLANMDYDTAANGVIRTMQAMQMQVSETSQITDAMINAANASSAELSDLVDWFEYSASSAHLLGVNVQDLSKYLGVLASMGTPGTGAAARQLFSQLMKTSVQEKMMEKYSFLNEDDFTDFNSFIEKMRGAAEASGDKKAFTMDAIKIFEGRPNAQQALTNLLTADADLWNSLDAAVSKTGTTQDLYAKSTANTADALKRIATNLEILQAQFGGIFAFIANAIATFTGAIVTLTTIIPDPFRKLIGAAILAAAGIAILISGLLGLVGMMAVARGATWWLRSQQLDLAISVTNVKTVFGDLLFELEKNLFANINLGNSYEYLKAKMLGVKAAAVANAGAVSKLQTLFTVGSIGLMAYMGASELMQRQMYAEAEVVNFLAGAYLALSVARMGKYNPLAVAGAVGVFVGYEALMGKKVEDLKRAQRSQQMDIQTRRGSSSKVYNINIGTAQLNADADDFTDFAEQMKSGGYDTYE